ncbi:hypothetical protein M0R45_002353 [Rubus argutus]|uniref:Secreted protein n=1 Tax=Rubus argutus TaxID=59490 RepID=A0AAW1VJM8_RUBAR
MWLCFFIASAASLSCRAAFATCHRRHCPGRLLAESVLCSLPNSSTAALPAPLIPAVHLIAYQFHHCQAVNSSRRRYQDAVYLCRDPTFPARRRPLSQFRLCRRRISADNFRLCQHCITALPLLQIRK